MILERVVSGGQTGVDRAALDAAREAGLPIGGWCPRGRRAEDGRIPDEYPLRELPSLEYIVRTEQNVIDSDGTLLLSVGPLEGGTRETARFARRHRRPLRIVHLRTPPPPEETAAWIRREKIHVLNVAGPRESGAPGIGGMASDYLRQVFDALKRSSAANQGD